MTSCPTFRVLESPEDNRHLIQCLNLDDCQVHVGVVTHDIGNELSPVGEDDLDLDRHLNYVTVGEDEPV